MSGATRFEGSYSGDASRIRPESRLECGVCWWVYDPQAGDELAQVPPGTAFAELPDHWVCPQCEAPRQRFMVVGE
ncbi:MAG: rubredoxin [Steroidobacteraceae bacterium]|jgi:rubredoxin|nr:rubredoxin [Steroidobacteraceae bacterium]